MNKAARDVVPEKFVPETVLQHPKFDLGEFRDRWERSRLSALASVLQKSSLNESALLKEVDSKNQDQVLRAVFENSRKFGLSAAKYLGVAWELSDLIDVLPRLGLPCFAESWRSHNSAQVLERSGCVSLGQHGSFGCDYWREALDGLVMGVGENERLARHRSLGHGDSGCLDVLFTEEYVVPRVVSAESANPKFGPIPSAMMKNLEPTQKSFESMKVNLLLKGFSEGTLFYQLDAQEGVLCGAGGKLMHESFAQDVAQMDPSLKIQDVSPIAVKLNA